jgi:hypothetical protein
MSTSKDQMVEMINEQPEGSTYEDVARRIRTWQK